MRQQGDRKTGQQEPNTGHVHACELDALTRAVLHDSCFNVASHCVADGVSLVLVLQTPSCPRRKSLLPMRKRRTRQPGVLAAVARQVAGNVEVGMPGTWHFVTQSSDAGPLSESVNLSSDRAGVQPWPRSYMWANRAQNQDGDGGQGRGWGWGGVAGTARDTRPWASQLADLSRNDPFI